MSGAAEKGAASEPRSEPCNASAKVRGRIYWVGGSKGGVGKSMLTFAVLDYLLERGEKVVLIECDTSNPDVWQAYQAHVPTELINLDEGDGWIHLVNVCDANRGRVIVLNTAARNNDAVTQYGSTLAGSLEELESDLIAFWVINRQRDGLELLKVFMETMGEAQVHVVRNGYFGEEAKFELYNDSKVRETIEKQGGKSITLPDLADRVADDIYSQRLALSAAAKSLPLGNRAELSRWRSAVRKVLGEVVS